MKQLFSSRSLYVGIAGLVVLVVILMVVGVTNQETPELITTTVEQGPVRQLVSVSGVAEAEQTAELAFPTGGIVTSVAVRTGDVVNQGDVLISLEASALQADRADAAATRNRAIATRDELLAGPQSETRAATAETVSFKATTLETIKATQNDLVTNAYRTLLSSDLEAISDDPAEDATPPIISGTYLCDSEGTYTLEVFSSKAESGYSYRLSGFEQGTYTASTEQPTLLGTCGLRAIFDPASRYSNTTWTISIPNKKSPQYVTNRNAYMLAQTQANSAVAVAEQDLALAQANATNANAPARSEAIARANADIASANARIARIDSQLKDRILTAPFSGTITEIDVLPGETVTTEPVITLLAETAFEVTARIPEIDIGKLLIGQPVEMVFDAKQDEILTGEINFISLKATEIDGVAYYEALINLTDIPPWMRSGLNADIDIIINEATDVLRLPRRFVTTVDDTSSVITKLPEGAAITPIEVLLEGDDGFVAITGVDEDEIIIAP